MPTPKGLNERYQAMVSNLKITTASPDTRSKSISEGKFVTYGLTFNVNKADIKSEVNGTLKNHGNVLKENASVRVAITGQPDKDCDNKLNLDLSKRRAEAIRNELSKISRMEASPMITRGAGESKPVAPNDKPANKSQIRQVEFI
jgi:OmpA-OmpF porin, OOP family